MDRYLKYNIFKNSENMMKSKSQQILLILKHILFIVLFFFLIRIYQFVNTNHLILIDIEMNRKEVITHSIKTDRNTQNNISKTKSTWIIIGFTDSLYVPVAVFWYERLKELGYNNHIIITIITILALFL